MVETVRSYSWFVWALISNLPVWSNMSLIRENWLIYWWFSVYSVVFLSHFGCFQQLLANAVHSLIIGDMTRVISYRRFIFLCCFSVIYVPLISQGHWGRCSQSQLTLGEGQSTPWAGRQFITGLLKRVMRIINRSGYMWPKGYMWLRVQVSIRFRNWAFSDGKTLLQTNWEGTLLKDELCCMLSPLYTLS